MLSVIERGTREDWQRMFAVAKQSPEVLAHIRAVTAPPPSSSGQDTEDVRGLNERYVWDLVSYCFPSSKRPAA